MGIIGIDISVEPRGSPDKAKFDAALLLGERVKHAVFSNTEAGFGQLLAWLAKHRPDPAAPLHACMEATGNWGLELADFLHAQGIRVSIVNPARIKAYGESELARNKTDKLDAGLTARFCRAHGPPAWIPPLPCLRVARQPGWPVVLPHPKMLPRRRELSQPNAPWFHSPFAAAKPSRVTADARSDVPVSAVADPPVGVGSEVRWPFSLRP